jgi:hypothetical protein
MHQSPRLLRNLFFAGLFMPVWAVAAPPVSEENHKQFEKKFADMCVENEKKAMQGSGVLLAEVVSVCECIAREESKRVTSEEVTQFVFENQYPASLMMKSNAATYTCVEAQKAAPAAH